MASCSSYPCKVCEMSPHNSVHKNKNQSGYHQWEEEIDDSEFGTILAAIYGGDIIETGTGEITYVSGAFNPLNEAQLLEILDLMKKLK